MFVDISLNLHSWRYVDKTLNLNISALRWLQNFFQILLLFEKTELNCKIIFKCTRGSHEIFNFH